MQRLLPEAYIVAIQFTTSLVISPILCAEVCTHCNCHAIGSKNYPLNLQTYAQSAEITLSAATRSITTTSTTVVPAASGILAHYTSFPHSTLCAILYRRSPSVTQLQYSQKRTRSAIQHEVWRLRRNLANPAWNRDTVWPTSGTKAVPCGQA